MFIYASVAYIAPVNGFAHFQITSPYPRGTDVFFRIRKHYETDKVEMFGGAAGDEGSGGDGRARAGGREGGRAGRGGGAGVAPPAAYTAPNLYITRAITCRYKSHRQIKF